jgi:ATP-dependent Lon protease
MEKVKERIIEYLSVLKIKALSKNSSNMKAPILCLYGPPGVGKTSLGRSIAEALGRKYARISLGGLHDESEIRGHRRTYIGAMPGRIIENIRKAKTCNPVFVLDEIDKIGADYKGDPTSALLEVLDPEQNGTFHDNYLDVDYDLSKVLFIATANSLDTIPRPLLDRMELIEMTGYLQEEKEEIAKRHLLPKELDNHGLKASQLKLKKAIISAIIDGYTRESGVRGLERQIAAICRKVVTKIALEEEYNTSVTEEDLVTYLGKKRYSRDEWETNKYVGVVTGLAWTQVGGEILFIETSLSPAKAPTLTLTGNLGDVMKESATIALGYIKAHAEQFGISRKKLDTTSVHVHVPEGAIPKDGPSAGITMTTALVSAFTGRKVRERVAMTGEMTLRGKVLPIGGVKEKLLAAKRAGITDIVLCEQNRKDVDEIPEKYLKGLKFHYVKDIQEVIDFAVL